MARFFKFIFSILLIAYAAVILALVIPPLVGITTSTVLESTEGNQAVGTVEYASRIPLQDLKIGERILVTGADSVNVYTVQGIDEENSRVTVANSETQEIPVRSYVYRMILSVPFIGYVIIALQSFEGVLVLALAAAVLVLFWILTRMWSKKAKQKKIRKKEQKAAEAERENSSEDSSKEADQEDQQPTMNPRAEAYFAARRAEESRRAAASELLEYENFPPAPQKQAAEEKELDYFDDDEDNEEADSWLHDDVDDEDLFSDLNNREATESLMATARLFAMDRAAKLKAQISSEDLDKTKVVMPEELSALNDRAAAEAEPSDQPVQEKFSTDTFVKALQEAGPVQRDAGEKPAAAVKTRKTEPVKNIEVDKVINLKELQELDEDTQQIVLTINIKVVSE